MIYAKIVWKSNLQRLRMTVSFTGFNHPTKLVDNQNRKRASTLKQPLLKI